ncbi:DUF2948 family protein [Maritimibacter sp. UBA3975]|uniref:DUF2948 family protein n=1 Tax=Maritimibacter sp. UBA3975 TaxID=1946833 RepID=UPI000C09105D|nr:DUF2948 family protein [Maritimibacter sp. UBA3975]MAM59884.1 hypothetical protein [Maritimibacter sp.]|tara:strand:- start:19722 stop:20201 length:480 start_codon:yes stop_codon:yes gene_type:complete
MTEDAKFEDGGDTPLRLLAVDADDLGVIAALTQDAVFPGDEMAWYPKDREFALLLNRFRWEDSEVAQKRGRPVERVQSVLLFGDVQKVQSQGVERRDGDTIMSLLSITFEPGEDGTGRVILTLAGDGAIALDVETINARLQDVTRPYLAPSRKTPDHPE